MSDRSSKSGLFPIIIRIFLFVFGAITIPLSGTVIWEVFKKDLREVFNNNLNFQNIETDLITSFLISVFVAFMISALPIYFSLSGWSRLKRFTQFLQKIPKVGKLFTTIGKFIAFKGTNFGLGIVLGFLIWALCEIITGKEEAVDAGVYLPLALLITGIISSLPSPKFFFSGALGIFVGQVAFMAFIPTGFGANLWPITAVMLVPAMLISMFGGVIVYIVCRKRSSGNQESSKDKNNPLP
jgi:hypothetical protein